MATKMANSSPAHQVSSRNAPEPRPSCPKSPVVSLLCSHCCFWHRTSGNPFSPRPFACVVRTGKSPPAVQASYGPVPSPSSCLQTVSRCAWHCTPPVFSQRPSTCPHPTAHGAILLCPPLLEEGVLALPALSNSGLPAHRTETPQGPREPLCILRLLHSPALAATQS